MHLSPDAPNIDAFVNGEGPAVSNLAFGSGTGALSLPAGTASLQIAPTGAPASSAVLSVDGVQLQQDRSYTAVAFGNVASIAGNVIEDSTQGLASNQVRLRVVHAAAGVGSVDVYLLDGSNTPIAENLFFGSAASAFDVPAQAFVAGIDVDNDAVADLIFNIPALTAGTNVNVYAVADGADVYLVAQLPGDTTVRIDPEAQQLRVLHLSPNAPPVTPLVNGSSLFNQVSFGQSTSYATVGGGVASLDVTLDGTLQTSALNVTVPLALGKRVTAVAFDNVANLSATTFTDDATGLPAGQIRVRAIHGAPSVGQVDLYALSDNGAQVPLLLNVNFSDVAAPLDLPAGTYTIGVDVDNDAVVDLVFALPTLVAGTLANVFVTEDATGAVFALAQLDGDVTARIEPGETTIRVVHLSRDAPHVDVFVDGALAVNNLAFKSQSGSATVLSGGASIAVTPTGAGIHNAVIDETVTLLPGRSYTVVAYDDVAPIKALVLEDDDGGIGNGNIRLPVTHVAPLVTRGDLFELVNGNSFGAQLVDDFGFGETQSPPDVPAAAYTVGFDANAIGVVAVSFDLPLVTPGTFARAFVYNEHDGSVAVLVTLPTATFVVPGF